MEFSVILAIFFSFVIGTVFGGMAVFLAKGLMFNRQMRIVEKKAAKMEAEARTESKNLLREAREEAERMKSTAEAEYRDLRSELQRQENRLSQKETTLERRLDEVGIVSAI